MILSCWNGGGDEGGELNSIFWDERPNRIFQTVNELFTNLSLLSHVLFKKLAQTDKNVLKITWHRIEVKNIRTNNGVALFSIF